MFIIRRLLLPLAVSQMYIIVIAMISSDGFNLCYLYFNNKLIIDAIVDISYHKCYLDELQRTMDNSILIYVASHWIHHGRILFFHRPSEL